MMFRDGRLLAVALAALVAWSHPARADDEEDAKPTTPLTRVVSVVGDDDKPLAGATVEAIGLPGGTATKTSGADGTVRFEDVPRKGVTFVVRAPGCFPAWHEPGSWWWHMPEEDEDPDGDGVTTMSFAPQRGTVLEGRVVTLADGAPIAGAHVEATESVGATDTPELRVAPIWTVTTDAEGRFRSDRHFVKGDRRPGLAATVTARAPGCISETVVVPAAADGVYAPVAFTLRPAATLRGVVLDPDGRPAAGVEVHAYPSDFGFFAASDKGEPRWKEDEHPRVLRVRTDDRGRWEMPELHPKTAFFVYAERRERPPGDDFGDGDAVARSDVATGVSVDAPGKERVLDLRLHAVSSLVVRVAPNAGGGSQGVRVQLDGRPWSRHFVEDETKDGVTSFRGLDPGEWTLRVTNEGWTPLTRKLQIPAGERVELTVRLDAGAAVEGFVVDDRGLPVQDARVCAEPRDPADPTHRLDRGQSALTDASGTFRVSGLPPGLADVSAYAEGFVNSESVRQTAPCAGLRLVIVRLPKISLLVSAPTRTALPETFRASVIRRAGRHPGLRYAQDVAAAQLPADLKGVEPGPSDVIVDLPGFAPSTLRIDAPPGETVTAGPFAFDAGVALAGRVVDGTGAPVAGATITPYENERRTATSDMDGRFVLPHLAPGPVELVVKADGFPETILIPAAAKDATTLDVVLRPGGVVRGKLTSSSGHKVEDRGVCIVLAEWKDAFGPHWHARTDAGPNFALRLPAGRYRIVPNRYEFGEANVLFDVTEGGETTADVVFPW